MIIVPIIPAVVNKAKNPASQIGGIILASKVGTALNWATSPGNSVRLLGSSLFIVFFPPANGKNIEEEWDDEIDEPIHKQSHPRNYVYQSASGIEWHRNHPRKEDSKHVGPKLSTKTTLEQVIANNDRINGDAG